MRPDLEVIRREGHEIVVVRVHHDVSAQISQFDEVFLPRFRPTVRPRIRNYDRIDTKKGFGEAYIEVRMKLAPVFGEVDRSPAAGDLGEVRGCVFDYVVGCEHGPGVEKHPSFLSCLDDLLLVQTDSEHVCGQVLVSTVPIPVRGMSDAQEPLGDEHNTCIEVGSSSTSRRREGTPPRRPQGSTRTNGLSVGTKIPQPQEGGQRGSPFC